jgi:hypothetical protein
MKTFSMLASKKSGKGLSAMSGLPEHCALSFYKINSTLAQRKEKAV